MDLSSDKLVLDPQSTMFGRTFDQTPLEAWGSWWHRLQQTGRLFTGAT